MSSTTSDIEEQYVVAIDIGTTTIRCQILNSKAVTIGSYRTNVRFTITNSIDFLFLMQKNDYYYYR